MWFGVSVENEPAASRIAHLQTGKCWRALPVDRALDSSRKAARFEGHRLGTASGTNFPPAATRVKREQLRDYTAPLFSP